MLLTFHLGNNLVETIRLITFDYMQVYHCEIKSILNHLY